MTDSLHSKEIARSGTEPAANDELLPPGEIVRVSNEYTYTHEQVMALVEDVAEYVHWRSVNRHIKGGGNYLSRFRKSLTPFTQQKE